MCENKRRIVRDKIPGEFVQAGQQPVSTRIEIAPSENKEEIKRNGSSRTCVINHPKGSTRKT